MAAKKSGGKFNYRSSKTGRYTTAKAAAKSTATHEKERRKSR